MNFFDQHRNSQFQFPPIPAEFRDPYSQSNWIIFESGIPYLPLAIDGPWRTMYAEALALGNEFVTHRSDGAGWSSLCVHGLSAKQTLSHDEYGLTTEQADFKWTEIEDRCSVTVDYFKQQFPFSSYQRIRYMRLAPGGLIPPHSDGPGNRMVAVNIALNNPLGCEMVMEDVGIVPFKDSGGALSFNNTRNHAVQNLSDTDRYHIIVHGVWDHRYSRLLVKSYQELLNSI